MALKILEQSRGGYPSEDKYSICDYNDSIKIYCLCDGASESFDSAGWSQKICEGYKETKKSEIDYGDLNPCIDMKFISEIKKDYDDDKNSEMTTWTWSKQASYLRGSFSTFLGAIVINDTIKIFAVGDSVAFLVNDEFKIEDSFFYKEVDQFNDKPILLSTNLTLNKFIDDQKFISDHTKEWYIKNKTILMMTDAISLWTMKNYNNPDNIKKLIDMQEGDFNDFIVHERVERRLRKDDVTVMILNFDK